MERNFHIHTQNKGDFWISESEAIQNALEQKAAGIEPMYKPTYTNCGELVICPAGWLIWSTYEDGCGVVYPRKADGKLILATGWQGDFITG